MTDRANRPASLLKLTGFLVMLALSVIAAGLFIDAANNTVLLAAMEKTMAKKKIEATPVKTAQKISSPSTELPGIARDRFGPAGYSSLPVSVFLQVPFSTQAPWGDWSQPWQDSCEETSALMAAAWVNNETLSAQNVASRILGAVAYEIYNFGYHKDTNLTQTFKLLTRFFDLSGARLEYDITLDDIKKELAAGNIAIVPVSGLVLALENPYFSSPPDYHMLVVRGYDDVSGEIITNDPGTKHGEAFRYSYAIFESAIHDWTGSNETILASRSGMIVVSRGEKPQ